ncbi:Ger(x)C family spore germination protein [Bacillus sp. PS06]|uniref:Ger(x)C family spore germination protein n=1 Tax=Bacillus sp. PS06 TaxID=2764176 RepID=UPI00178773E8|nr:Ger(x)C family spore germination protein [Bacillus sp. PS06]MBD8068043.1 Ger(x)C family spore germination protein [Bacillus sp. PS06]
MRKILLLNMCCTLLVLTGCWDSIELNEVSIVTGMAIEKGENKKYKLSVEVINAAEFAHGGGTGDTPVVVFALEGDSISELSDKMNKGYIRKLIYSHTRLIVIDEQVAKKGMVDFFDFLERSGEVRNDFNIMIAKGVKASDIIKTTYPGRKSPSMKIHYQAETFLREWGGDPHLRFTDFIEAFVSKGRQPVAAAITIEGNPKKGNSVDNNKNLDLEATVVFDGMAIFKYDTLLGFLSLEDTRNYLWINELEKTTITAPCSVEQEQENKYIDVKINHSTAKRRVTYQDGIPNLSVEVIVEANLQGTQCPNKLSEMESYLIHEKSIEKFIKEQITGTIEKVQDKYQVDIFGFGEDLRRSDYKKWKEVEGDWDEEFSTANVEVKAKAFLRRSGVRTDSFISEVEKKD